MPFTGFERETVRFLSGLSTHNDKTWFDAHRADYDAHCIEPAKAFVEALAPALAKLDPAVHAEPRVNGSIMRIHRDTRFSKDKKPYKDHLDLFFWSGEEKGWDNSGFFFRLTPTKLWLGAGMHAFSPPVLARYRSAVLDAKKGAALARIVGKLREAGHEVGGETYKKTPRGVEPDHPRAGLLKHSGLHASWAGRHPKELRSADLVGFVAAVFKTVAPLHGWLRGI